MANKPTPSQSKAIENHGHNILVSAGAGSGKTGVLKDRVIHKLKHGIHVDELIILTFTKAAASEMKTRIIEAINEDFSLKPELSRVDNAIITTFDAFCLRLVKEYHYLLDLPSSINIGDKIQFLTMEKEVLEEVIKFYYQKEDKVFEEMIKLYFQKGDDFIYEVVRYLAHKLQKAPNYSKTIQNLDKYLTNIKLEEDFKEFEKIIFNESQIAFDRAKDLNSNLAVFDKPSIVKYLDSISIYFSGLMQDDFNQFLSYFKNTSFPRKPVIKNDEEIKDLLDYYHPRVKSIIDKIKKIINDLNIDSKETAINSVLSTKTNVLKVIEITDLFITKLNQAKKEKSLFQYQDIMDLAIKLLEENEEIRSLYKAKINEIMIDEYQDTNDLQVYFVSLISKDNLFMVGDIKQSIYGFRDANPKNFHDKYVQYSKDINGELIPLRENFRSREEVLEDINKVFKEVMDEEIGGINYQDNQSLIYGLKAYDNKIESQHYGIDFIKYDLEQLKEENDILDRTVVESELLARDIRNKIDSKYQILDKDFRDIKYSDIAIIIDRKTDFKRLTEMLSKYSIPVNLYSDEPFVNSSEMIFIISMIKLLYCKLDFEYSKVNFKRLFYSVARSFVYKISDELIISYLLEDNCSFGNLKHVSSFKAIYELINELSNKVSNLPVSEIIKLIYQKTDIYRMISYLDNPRKKEEKLDFFLETISGFENFNYSDLITYLDSLVSNPEWDIEYRVQKSDIDAVSLMTMHKSKGLQFPVVYCPFLSKKFNFVENKNLFIYDENYGLITNAFSNGFNKTFTRYLSLHKNKRDYISERIRLLYVAFTRAKENLVLFSDVSDIKEEYKELSNNYISNQIRMKYNSYTDLLSSTNITDYDYYNKPISDFVERQFKRIEISNTSLIKKKFSLDKIQADDKRFSKSEEKLFSDDVINKIEYGNNVHLLLENFDFDSLESSLIKLPNPIRKSFEYLLDTKIFDFNKNPKVYQEYEFYQTSNLESKHGIIDLLVIYQDIVYIVDYKLKNISDKAYSTQLNGYKKYIEEKTNKPVKTYLYSIIAQVLQEIT